VSPGTDPDASAAVAYVRRVRDAKGPSDGPVLDEREYVRYVTGSRRKRPKGTVTRARSRDRVDEVL